MFKRPIKKGYTQKKKRKPFVLPALHKQLLIGFLVFVTVAIVLVGVWYGTRIESLQIKDVQVVGGFTIPHAQITKIANDELARSHFRLIPNRFSWLYPKSRIEKRIAEIDKVKNVHIELVNKDVMAIRFEEYKPYALWCERKESESCIFIDGVGYAFAQAPALTGSAFVRYVQDDDAPVLGQMSFEMSFIEDTKQFIEMLEESLSLYVTHVHKLGDYDIEYTVSGGGIIKVSQTLTLQDTFKNLETILTSKAFEHIGPGAFNYIDLRFGDKIFIKEEVAEPEAGAATSSMTQEESF